MIINHQLKTKVFNWEILGIFMKFRFYALKLCGFIILVFLAQSLISGFTELFILDGSSWWQVWRFISAIFLHDGLTHLIYNLFALILFGNLLEVLIGGRRFLAIFLISGILANLVAINFYSNSLGLLEQFLEWLGH